MDIVTRAHRTSKNFLLESIASAYRFFLIIFSFFVLTPFVSTCLLFFYFYRRAVDLILRIQLKDNFVGLLDGMDCVWAIEESCALSVINVLVILEKDARHSNLNFLEHFRSLVRDRILESPYEKLLYSRKKKFGYYFWEKNDRIDLRERVRWLGYERGTCDGSCDNIYNGHLKRILRNVCNQPLPDDHTASWEILIGRTCPRSSYHYLRRMEERPKNGRIRLPILFRVHHSLGDGPALLKFFLNVVVDGEPAPHTIVKIKDGFKVQKQEDLETITVTVPRINYSNMCLVREQNLTYTCKKNALSAAMPFAYLMDFSHFSKTMRNHVEQISKYLNNLTFKEAMCALSTIANSEWTELKNCMRSVYQRFRGMLSAAMILVAAPVFYLQQTRRSMDDSALHGSTLSGEKVLSYWLEDDFRDFHEQRLLSKIQSIKCITGATFRDVLLAALSSSLHKYFLRVNKSPPDSLTVVLPTTLEPPNESISLRNTFSVGLLPLCISKINGEAWQNPREDSKVFDRLQDVKTASQELKRGPDYMVNYLVMKYLCAALPENLLRMVLESHSTMVFSDLLCPKEARILGHPLKNVTFWIPNRNHTGIGCSLLTYRGYLHLSLVADKKLVQDEKLLTEVLENTVHEIDELYDRLTSSSFSKKFEGTIKVATPTKKVIGVLLK